MKVVHFSTNNEVGINLSVDELKNGNLLIIRTVQTANPEKACPPELFTVRAEERHSLMEYLADTHIKDNKFQAEEVQ